MRKLTADDVSWQLLCEPEDEAPDGCFASGDEEEDRATVRAIYKDLEDGNEWAWCYVQVLAQWGTFTGRAGLGCCNYASAEDFRQGGYYEDMRAEALAHLNAQLAEVKGQLDQLDQLEE